MENLCKTLTVGWPVLKCTGISDGGIEKRRRDTESPKVDCQELRLEMLMTSPGEKEFSFSNVNSATNGALAQYGLHPLFKNSP